MSTEVTVSIPPDLAASMRQAVDSGRFATPEAVFLRHSIISYEVPETEAVVSRIIHGSRDVTSLDP